MYCVKCGVKLQNGVNICPLCHTVMHYEEQEKENESTFSSLMPQNRRIPALAYVSICTAVLLIGAITVLLVCLNVYGHLSWGSIVLVSIALFYGLFVLPFWFTNVSPIWFISIDFALIALLLLTICLYCNGHWFLSFAFPIVLLTAALFITAVALRRHYKKAGNFICGGLFIATGLFCMLIEMFETITFHTPMFTWSLYVVAVTAIVGLFLILCGIIPSLKESLSKRFYI